MDEVSGFGTLVGWEYLLKTKRTDVYTRLLNELTPNFRRIPENGIYLSWRCAAGLSRLG
jgi:hypothetical protein